MIHGTDIMLTGYNVLPCVSSLCKNLHREKEKDITKNKVISIVVSTDVAKDCV